MQIQSVIGFNLIYHLNINIYSVVKKNFKKGSFIFYSNLKYIKNKIFC